MKSPEGPNFLKYWLILKRRWLPAGGVALALFIFMFGNVSRKPNIYQSKGQLRFSLGESSPKIDGIQALSSGSESSGWDSQRLLATEIRTMFSREFLFSVIQQSPQFLAKKGKLDVDSLRDGLKVLPVQDTDVVEVSFDSLDPELAAQVVNQLMQVYVRSNLQSNRAKARATREFIAGQLPRVRQRVFVADSILRRFKETYRVVDLTAAKSAAVESQAKLQEQLGNLDAQLADVDSQIVSLRRQLGGDARQALAESVVGQSPAVQEVLKSQESVQQQLREARARLAPDHPAVLDLQDRQRELQVLLQERFNAALKGQSPSPRGASFVGATRQGLMDNLLKYELTRTGLVQQRQSLADQKIAYANQTKVIPGLEQRQRELERELAAAEATYQSLLKSLQDIQVTENETIPTVKIIDSAIVPTTPVGPNRTAELLRSAIAALMLGAAVAYLLEITDRRLKNVDSIREAYPYPLLGNIPMFEMAGDAFQKIPVFAEPNSMVSEAYRMLQANLKFLRSDAPVRIITITSAQPGEGKSVTTANLAAVLSQLGHQVLLIDADLRRPTTHQIWEVPNGFGLSNVLTTAEDESFNSLPVHIINENLQILTAGPIPPNPLALIDSQRMGDFLKAQAQRFDYILLDTPPLTVAADPLVLSRFTDGILLIARPELVEKGSAKVANSSLQQSGSNVLGVVANGVIIKNESYSYYYYTKNYYGNPPPKDESIKSTLLDGKQDLKTSLDMKLK
ncbi:GumC family protein [Altericista sp. CCNU0014]|uniref:GumC family protein n=1 Tax=Altericista sp. CCNU0014 TaxID=3082949 RepID=UPI00384E3266